MRGLEHLVVGGVELVWDGKIVEEAREKVDPELVADVEELLANPMRPLGSPALI